MDLVHYFVQSPWTNIERGKDYPLIEVTIMELSDPVTTKTGLLGAGIRADVETLDGKYKCSGIAVYAPEPNVQYSFMRGAKLALKRAMASSKLKKETRTNIWTGFFQNMVELERVKALS